MTTLFAASPRGPDSPGSTFTESGPGAMAIPVAFIAIAPAEASPHLRHEEAYGVPDAVCIYSRELFCVQTVFKRSAPALLV